LVHISHVKLYSDADLEREVELQEVAEQLEHAFFKIRKLLDLRYEASKMEWQVLCAWRGYSDEESAWELVSTLTRDTPDFLEKLLTKHEDQELVARCRAE
jgi:Chromo (CHRromatin Organisation MOdifier) domain